MGQVGLNLMDSVSSQEKSLQSRRKREVSKYLDIVVCEVNRIAWLFLYQHNLQQFKGSCQNDRGY
jgi:hypothetical protein